MMKLKKITQLITASAIGLSFSAIAVPTSGDYVTDEPRTFTNNLVQGTLNQINNILCMVRQTNPNAQAGNGDYLAMVDMNGCGMGQGAASQGTQMITVFVNSSIDEDQILNSNMWFDGVQAGPQGGSEQIIQGKGQFIKPAGGDNAYGVFSMNYAGYEVDSDLTDDNILMRGVIEGTENDDGTQQLIYVETNNGTPFAQLVINKDADGIGYGKISALNNQGTDETKTFAFNNQYLQNKVGDNTNVCFDRTDTENIVYGYGLYDADGNRVSLNTGFPVRFTKDNGDTVEGWMGYHGLHLPGVNINSLSDGDALTKVSIQDGSTETGELVKYNNRLEKQTSQAKTLQSLNGLPITWFKGQTNDVLQWDSEEEEFSKVGEENCSDQGCFVKDLDSPQPVDLSSIPQQFLDLDIPGIGFTGLQIRDFTNPDPDTNLLPITNNTELRIFTSEIVKPESGGGTLNLYCYNECPVKVGDTIEKSSPDGNSVNYIPYTISLDSNANNTYVLMGPEATIDESGLVNSLISEGTVSMASQNIRDLYTQQWTPANWSNQFSANTVYNWQAGNNQWNQLITFKDSDGNISDFDAPLKLVWSDPDSGDKFVEYEGFGRINGIPEQCKDMTTGEVLDQCFQSGQVPEGVVFIPEYNIPTGATLTSLNDNNTEYFVKQLEIGQIMAPLSGDDETTCINALQTPMSNAEQETIPTIDSNWTNPELGAKPSGIDQPTVINGVNQ